jgi:predicted Zn-dependent peptidase
MLTRGTNSRSRTDFNNELQTLGARLHGESGREQTSIGLTVFKNDVSRAVNLLGDAISNTRLDAGELEILK